ncbi:Cloroperoxidase [Glarea lozoyensis ATCC 20868]|uniref:Cloroperoxidase n=2 Tax=Glarea lozoyensis TaxID=101852 RepID=S3CJ64_GLAL2|nr:Cloroperoxidase [Glarea lozoyensis ATCC 20868]EHL00974.1 putative Aromatic peroxygenase [Glarea lozoyensis 74030]EPE26557.1 Cloroperoxidase [Glarea lozoyensis ATCC 20868]
MQYALLTIALTAPTVLAFPFVAQMPGVDSSLFMKRQQSGGSNPGGPATCPNNPNHVPAPGITAQYPYNGAKNGAPGKGVGGYRVPAVGDTAHQFVAPGPNDIRGPCPGLNAAANHNFLAHDGVTTFNELVDAQQNLYNVGYDLSVLLALLGLTLTDGDIVTEKLSIGCDATTRTSFNPVLTGSEPGLDGHNKFEADTSLTRNDFFLGKGDNFSFNGTLYKMMQTTTGSNYNRDNLAKYRYERYQQSLRDNPNFYFGPLSLLLFGASSFLYELMPSGTRNYAPDEYTISSFFGAERQADGTYTFNNQEKIPDNWTNRVKPYTNNDVTAEILAQYLEYPVLFGGATGNGGFDLLNFGGSIQDGKLIATPGSKELTCLLYQLATQSVPSYLNGVITPTVEAVGLVSTKIGGTLVNLGCPQPLT